MLSMKAKYALRALIVLAKSDKKMLQTRTIAESGDIPQKFLEAILVELKRDGFVNSKRGIFGGYFLAKESSEIMLGAVIRTLDGPLAPIRCASITAYQKCEDCLDETTCEIRRVMLDVRNAIAGVLDAKSLKEICQYPADLLP